MKITGSGPSAGTSQRRRVSDGTGDGVAGAFAEHVGARARGELPASRRPRRSRRWAACSRCRRSSDPTAERRRAIRHGHSLLDELRELQLGMVDGRVSEGTLRRLAGLVDGLRPSAADARLAAVLDAIELRAAVELAKLRRDAE